MKKRVRLCFVIPCLILLIFPMGCSEKLPDKVRSVSEQPDSKEDQLQPITGKKILLVHSYHAEYPWVDSITKGVQATLEGTGVDLDIFYMDTKRKTEEAWKIRSGELAQKRVEEYQPDLVITSDDNAQQYFAMKYVEQSLPFVFCGVNADPSKYGYPASNVTGIIERPHFKRTLDFLKQVKPTKKIALLSCNDSTSVGALNFMKQDYVDVEVVEWTLINGFEEWKSTILRYNESVDAFGIYMYHTIKEAGSDISLEPKVVMDWTRQNAQVPTLGFFDFGIEDGLLLGIVESGFEHGEKATQYALEILQGTPLSSLPIIKANVGTKMLNRQTADRLGISLNEDILKDVVVAEGE